jgi:uncharacterized metal-binding protein YceD (DUF177 family)
MSEQDDATGFSRALTLAQARAHKGAMTITATDAERAAIARRFDLVAVNHLDATLTLTPDGDALSVTGTLTADLVQRCVATDEPLPAKIAEAIDVRYVPADRLEAAEAEAEVELGSEDLDLIGYTAGRVDLGQMIADTLYLALDPFPRHPDADAFLAKQGVKSEGEAGAFGALAALRDKLAPKGA